MVGRDEFTEDDWTPEERALLASLPTERTASDALKRRTMDALHSRRLLGTRTTTAPKRILALVAAASLIFITGALVGYAVAQRSTKPVDATRTATSQDVARAGGATTNNPPARHVVWY